MKISVIIPTQCPLREVISLLQSLKKQTLSPAEIIILDSYLDENPPIVSPHVQIVKVHNFSHGGTRNWGAKIARGEILLFMTQDAYPKDKNFLANLTQPLIDSRVAAAFARQIPYPTSNPLESFARNFNYPDQSLIKNKADLSRLGIRTYFFSNVASAFCRKVFWKLTGFPESVIVNEDMFLCYKLIERGFSVAYQAEARVYHSHNYSLEELGRRYFDIGVFFSQAPGIFQRTPPEGEGFRFVFQQLKYLLEKGYWTWIPRGFMEAVIKYFSFHFGRVHANLPLWLILLWSSNRKFWKSKASNKSL